MKKFKITRSIVITTTDIIEAESEKELWEKVDNGKSLAGEISDYGIADNHLSVKYEFLDEEVENFQN